MISPQDYLKKLQESAPFKEWQENHQDFFLSHFFSQVGSNLEVKSNWEVGFYIPEHDKIAVFLLVENDFQIKPEDDIFKKDDAKVEKLNLEKIKINFDEASKIFKENSVKLFPNESLGDGFIVLQTLNELTQWNFTLITKSLKFINIKINTETGKIDSHQAVELVQK